VEGYLLTSTVNRILAQHLIRCLCPLCREGYRPRPELAAKFTRLHAPDAGDLRLYRAVGCERCNDTGYRGRMVIAEVLVMTDLIRQAELSHATATDIRQQAMAEGMLTMHEDGLRKILGGHTTVDEVMRVTEERELWHASPTSRCGETASTWRAS